MANLIAAARAAHSRRQQDYTFACALIWRLRNEHNLTFAEIGKLIGMSASTAHHMSGQHGPPLAPRARRRSPS